MMTVSTEASVSELRAKIHAFIQERLQAKLDKLKPGDHEGRARVEAEHEPETWLADAARRVGQLQVASHIVKAIHPDARGTNVNAELGTVPVCGVLGTASLDRSNSQDVVGNAAALDVYKFLCVTHRGSTLLGLAIEESECLLAALSSDRVLATQWQLRFATIAHSTSQRSSHTLAKQLYFPVQDEQYHVLAPLFPSSLVHQIHRIIGEDRFGDAARAAREARNQGRAFDRGYREYPELAVRKLGGTKPQNVSQLNSERRGENWLLASLPPNWSTNKELPPWDTASVLPVRFGRQPRVRELVDSLRRFLETVRHNNVDIRRHRAALVEDICDEAHQYAARLARLPAGWTADPRCQLHDAERQWLDPYRAETDPDFASARREGSWVTDVSHRFGNWLNSRLSSKRLRLGEDEQAQWKADLASGLRSFQSLLEDDHD